MRVLLAAAVLPAAVAMWLIYRMDRVEREPVGLMWKLVLFGALAVIPAVALETVAQWVLAQWTMGERLFTLLTAFVGVGMVEEGCKLVLLRLGSWRDPAFDYRFDGLLYAVFVSMGFAAVENILYLLRNGMSIAITRAIFSIPGHLAFGVAMGLFYANAKALSEYGNRAGKRRAMTMAFLVPTLLHGFFDYCLMRESWILSAVFFVFAAALDLFIVIGVKNAAAHDAPLPGSAFRNQRNGYPYNPYGPL